MKSLVLGLLVGLLAHSAFAAEVDPRVLRILREEQSAAQTFCFTFAHDGVRNGTKVAETCLSLFSARYLGNFHVANATKVEKPEAIGAGISRAHAAFCSAIGEYTLPGGWTRGDCDAWNLLRAEVYRLGTTEGTPTATLSAKIEKTEGARRRFCQSLARAGNPGGDPTTFSRRTSLCFAGAKQGTATDRAIFLGAF